jgi:hypothetical protein
VGFFDPLPNKGWNWSPDSLRQWLNGETIDYTKIRNGWQDWSPTLANLTLGSGTVVARYQVVAGTVIGYFIFTLGSGSAVGTAPTFTLPVTASASYTTGGPTQIGTAKLVDTGTASFIGHLFLSTTSIAAIQVLTASGTFVGAATVTATVPHTWASTDVLTAAFVYEAA